MKFVWICCLLLFATFSYAKPGFEETEILREAYHAVFDLRLDEAYELLEKSKLEDPDNYLVYHIENYIDFIRLFIGEDIDLYDQLKDNRDLRLDQLEKGDEESPYFLFCQAEVKFHWAIIDFKFDKKFSAGLGAASAYSLLKRNSKLFPDFISNKKTLSAIHALGEVLPGWLRALLDVQGSIKVGLSEIQDVINFGSTQKYIFKEESIAIYSLILYHLGDQKEKAWEVLNSSDLDPRSSLVAAFLFANIGQKTGRNDDVIEILTNRPIGEKYYAFHYLDYLLGKSKLNRLDKDANIYLIRFLENFKGQHYIKEAYQKLAWYELVINDNFPAYKKQMRFCQLNGVAVIGSDKQAEKEAGGYYVPDPGLLISRLYFDGGYFHKAYRILIKDSYKYEENSSLKLEYYYRLARVTESLKNFIDAISYYDMVIKLGENKPEYYACKSALQLGVILEHEKKYKLAISYYQKCLEIKPIEYKNEIHAGANAGLDRISDMFK